MKHMVSVRDAMETNVLTAGRNTTVVKAAKAMAERGVGSIIIVDRKRPVGILTERDLLIKVVSADLKPSKVRVGKIMSTPIITTTPDADQMEAARLMAKSKVRRLPVVENGKIVGVVTAMDIAVISPEIAETVEHTEQPTRERIDQSVCEACGEVTTDLYEVNGSWVCENCRDSMSE